MIRYHAIVAVLLIYSISTDAAEFTGDLEAMETHLIRDETTSDERDDILCDVLDNDQKQTICDEIMNSLVRNGHRRENPTFKHGGCLRPGLKIQDPENPYKCEERYVDELDNMVKRMYWCRAQQFYEARTGKYDVMDGFFCAASQQDPRTVYVFRPFTENSVSMVGEANNVHNMPSSVSESEQSSSSVDLR